MKNQKNKTPPKNQKRSNPRSHAPQPRDSVPAPVGPDFPHWLPTDNRWQSLPQNIRDAVPRILAPAYRRFVLEAPSELERSVGLTLVHLAWLELCGQVQLAIAAGDPTSLDAILNNPDDMLDRHLRLATVKCQTAELLMKLRIVQSALNRPAPLPELPPPSVPTAPPPFAPVSSLPSLLSPLPSPLSPENGNPDPC
jgi:hypothetical protein